MFESEEAEWGAEKVIGSGFDPQQKKVFFTVDSQLLHVVHCKSEEFGTPLYPILAANTQILVVVNMGQSLFKYSSNLFSMTSDSQSLHAYAIKGSRNSTNKQAKGSDHKSEVELLEIVLEDGRRS